MKTKDQTLLEQAYQSVHEEISTRRAREIDAMHFKNAGTNSYPQHSDQEDPQQLGDGSVTAKYKTVQPGMGSRESMMQRLADACREQDALEQGGAEFDALESEIQQLWGKLNDMGVATRELNRFITDQGLST